MKKFILIPLFFCLTVSYAQQIPPDYYTFIKKGEDYLREKNKNAPYAYSAAFKTIGWRLIPTGNYVNDCYNAALAWTLVREADSAFFYLDRIINKLSFTDIDKLAGDSGFILLHSDKRWQPLLKNIMPKNVFEDTPGWFKAGSKPTSYQMGTEKGSGKDGNNAATIKSINKTINGFGTLMQNFKPDKYRGKRIRMRGFMKSKDVDGWAGLWLRIDGQSKEPLSFDNMKDRSVKGTSDWKQYDVVLDVPTAAANIAFGALLDGTGQIWFDNVSFEIVDTSVPTTGKESSTDPINLDFEK